jgi:hypothetical protein
LVVEMLIDLLIATLEVRDRVEKAENVPELDAAAREHWAVVARLRAVRETVESQPEMEARTEKTGEVKMKSMGARVLRVEEEVGRTMDRLMRRNSVVRET